jgi:tRNA uridine 5-carboxymethylaminomethyl modification enzyme
VPRRNEAYLGVLVDDLITKGVSEPYRMFTSRAEHRLYLREDNADLRLTERGRELGLVDDVRWAAFNRKRDAVAREGERLKATWVYPAVVAPDLATRTIGKPIEHEYSLADLMQRPGVGFDEVVELALVARPDAGMVSRETLHGDLGAELADAVISQVEIGIKYAGYIERQGDEIKRAAVYEALQLPSEIDYSKVTALSFEVRQKLNQQRPTTLGQASSDLRCDPAAISLLLVHLRKGRLRSLSDGDEMSSAA